MGSQAVSELKEPLLEAVTGSEDEEEEAGL
jgi:hypothetical protein